MKLSSNIYILYLRAIWFLRRTLGIKTYGIGWIATKVTKSFTFIFRGASFRFLPSAAKSYCLLPAGIPNEPETHQFLEHALSSQVGQKNLFIDVDTSIGEFVIPMSLDPRVARVVAFEPHPASAEALRVSMHLNNGGSSKGVATPVSLEVIEMAVGAESGFASSELNSDSPTAAGLNIAESATREFTVPVCTLDEKVHITDNTPVLILIDIEGGEVNALHGSRTLVASQHPLIILEYNALTRNYFDLSEVRDLLGKDYKLYRLRSQDGRLDQDLSDTWNVVALPQVGAWTALTRQPELLVQ